jgi:hypothetical protein
MRRDPLAGSVDAQPMAIPGVDRADVLLSC